MYEHVVVKNGVLWIDGIHMQRFQNTTPEKNASLMVKQLGIKPGSKVLDVCTGLGYTVIEELKCGAQVATIEKSEKVLECLRQSSNRGILHNKNVNVICGDAFQEIKFFSTNSFDAVLHDPPRFSMAGELYSQEFYNELKRVLKLNGKLFHYTGKPGLRSGKNFLKGIKLRLQQASFRNVEWVEEVLGFKAATHS